MELIKIYIFLISILFFNCFIFLTRQFFFNVFFEIYSFGHTTTFFCFMLLDENLSHIHILYTQKGVYIIFENKTNNFCEAFHSSITLRDAPAEF